MSELCHQEDQRRRMIHADFGRTVEVVTVECGKCFRAAKHKCDHTLSDIEIAKRHYRGWKIKGVRGAKITRCPNCN